MPEIVTKYPEIVIKILREAGIECGTGAPQTILTACPAERFCSLPTGEICVYGLNEISKATQITMAEITKLVSKSSQIFTFWEILLIAFTFVAGILLGILLQRKILGK